jgi:hypothetical protein
MLACVLLDGIMSHVVLPTHTSQSFPLVSAPSTLVGLLWYHTCYHSCFTFELKLASWIQAKLFCLVDAVATRFPCILNKTGRPTNIFIFVVFQFLLNNLLRKGILCLFNLEFYKISFVFGSTLNPAVITIILKPIYQVISEQHSLHSEWAGFMLEE